MFDINKFKKSVRAWMNDNQGATEVEFLDYCESLVPVEAYASHKWLIDQTQAWFKHVKAYRESANMMGDGFDDVA